MKTIVPIIAALALAGCAVPGSFTGPHFAPTVEVEPWADPGAETVYVDDGHAESTALEYWSDEGGAYYAGVYYPGATFVAGPWDDSYFPDDGCYVPGGALLRVDRPRDTRIRWRAYHGHRGSRDTGYSVLREPARRGVRSQPGRVQERSRQVSDQPPRRDRAARQASDRRTREDAVQRSRVEQYTRRREEADRRNQPGEPESRRGSARVRRGTAPSIG